MKMTKEVYWTAPNGKEYRDTVYMSMDQYEEFVNNLLRIKKENNPN